MKKILILLVVLAFLPALVKADPPKKVTVTYADGKLKIVADHPTKDIKSHFIYKIVISVDGKEVKQVDNTEQTDNKAETIEVEIPEIKAGCEVSVKATCNKFGSKTAKIKI